MRIEVRELEKSFGAHRVLRGISLEVKDGEMVALLGPSGCGKTTLLRIIAGLEFADRGEIRLGGENVTHRPVRERGLGFVFQHFALFRHLTVFENVAFGLRVKPWRERPGRDEIRDRVMELLRLVRLEPYARHLPGELSGGQRQRVALARALAVEPRVLLLDEPFGSLDAQVRRELRGWLRRLHEELHLTSVLVTHDQEEALEVADRVALMDAGEIVQIGSPEEVYRRPAGPFVYGFLGTVNLFAARLERGVVRLAGGWLAAPAPTRVDEGPVRLYVRPHHLELGLAGGARALPAGAEGGEAGGSEAGSEAGPAGGSEGGVDARVVHVHAAGPVVRIDLECAGGERASAELSHERYDALCRAAGADVLERGRTLRWRAPAEHLYLDAIPPDAMPSEGGATPR